MQKCSTSADRFVLLSGSNVLAPELDTDSTFTQRSLLIVEES